MKKFCIWVLFITLSTSVFAKIEVKQEIKTEKATYSCYNKKCERIDGEEEKGVKFKYTSITTSNSGKSSAKRQYACITDENGANCRAIQ